jgi:hypothetical protein
MTAKLWQLVAVIACATFVLGIGFGRYVVPNDPVNSTGATFEQHMNDAFEARQGSRAARGRIEQRYGTTTESTDSALVRAQDYVRAAVPAMEAYNADHGGYKGMTVGDLQYHYDSGISNVELVAAGATTYCIQSSVAGETSFKAGPSADILPGTC